MSKKLISFKEATSRNLIKEGMRVDPNELFQKEIDVVALFDTKEETVFHGIKKVYSVPKNVAVLEAVGGRNRRQWIQKENLEWYFVIGPDLCPMILGSPTSSDLTLGGGESDMDEGVEALDRSMAILYSNKSLGLKARNLKIEDVNYFQQKGLNPDILSNFNCWLSSKYTPYKGQYGIYYFEEDHVRACSFRGEYLHSNYYWGSACPVLSIPETNIFVDEESYQQNGIWRLTTL